jgi:acyl-CoA thioesterase
MQKMIELDTLRQAFFGSSPYHQDTQTEPVEIGEGYAVCRMPIKETYFHAGRVMHGGIAYALADTAVAIAVVLAAGPEKTAFTIEGKLNYFASIPMGTTGFLYAKAQIRHMGKSTAVADVDVTFQDRTISHGIFTFAVREMRPA